MVIIYSCIVMMMMMMMMCINLGNSLENTKNRSPSEERFNFFDAELLQVFNRKENKNLLISPISIKLVLGMLMEGAGDKSADEIRTALRLPDEEEARRKEFNNWLSVLQTKDSPNILKIANRIFYSNRYSIQPDYTKALQKYYSGGVASVNFENAVEASRLINTWVGNETSEFIPSIVDESQISSENKIMIASVIYFKGIWSNPFSSERSSVRCFYSKDNKCEDSLMMVETGYFDYGYISMLDAKAIVLPYKGGKFSMLLLLPSKKNRIELLGRDLVHVSLASILSELQEKEVFVQIPQFEISYSDDLVESLKNVQIFEMFGKNANLSKMITSRLDSASITHFFHSAKIIVNEEGTEGAAATGALFVPLMGGTTLSFVANHPFLFFVMNSAKNSVLFAGKVMSPQTSDSKKSILSLNNAPPKNPQNQFRENLGIPLSFHKTEPRKTNSTAKESSRVKYNDLKHNQRGQPPGPKFRSIAQPKFSRPKLSWIEKNSTIDAPIHSSIRRTLIPRPSAIYEKGTQNHKKRGKNAQEILKNSKGQEASSDDWRHHVLFFT